MPYAHDAQAALINAMSDHGQAVRDACYELADLASAAAMMGQARLAQRLETIAAELPASFDTMNRAQGTAVHASLVAAEQATANMVKAAISGIQISKEH